MRGGIIPQEEHSGFGERPLEMRIADFAARGARAFAGGFPGTLDQTTGGRKILYPREACDVVNFIEEHEAEDLADAGDRLQQIQGLGVMVLGGFDDSEFDVTPQIIIGGNEREIAFDALLHRWIGKTLRDPVAIRFLGDLFANGWQGILAVGILDMGEEFAAFAGQGHAAAQQIASGAHLGRIHLGLREHPAAQQDSNLMGVDLVVFGFAAVDGLQRESMAEHKRNPVLGTQIGKPVPGKHAFGGQDDLIVVGRNGLEQRLWGGGHVAVHECFTGLVEDAHIHGAGVEIDPAVKRVLSGGESH